MTDHSGSCASASVVRMTWSERTVNRLTHERHLGPLRLCAAVHLRFEGGDLEIGSIDQLAATRIDHQRARREASACSRRSAWGWFETWSTSQDTTTIDKVSPGPYIRGVLASWSIERRSSKRVYKLGRSACRRPAPTTPRSPACRPKIARASWPYDPARPVATLQAHGYSRSSGWTRRPAGGRGLRGRRVWRRDPRRAPRSTSRSQANVSSSVYRCRRARSKIFANEARWCGERRHRLRHRDRSASWRAEVRSSRVPAAGYVDGLGISNYGALTDSTRRNRACSALAAAQLSTSDDAAGSLMAASVDSGGRDRRRGLHA